MGRKRIRRTKELKFQIAIEAIKGEKQVSEIAQEFGVHPNQVIQWKKKLVDEGVSIFASKKELDEKALEKERESL